jgi:hypothetical protein
MVTTNKLLSTLAMAGGLLALSAGYSPAQAQTLTTTPQTEEDQNNGNYDFSLGFNFKFRKTQEGTELADFLEPDRATFEKSMPGFRDFLKVGDILPTIGVQARIPIYDFASLPRDSLLVTAGLEFSSSAIFGKLTDKKTFDASVQDGAIHLGATPTTWEQNLNHYVAVGAGLSYILHEWGQDYRFFPMVEVSAYLTHMNSESVLLIHVDGDEGSHALLRTLGEGDEEAGWAIANQLDVYEDIRTDASTSGWGARVEGGVGVGVGFPGGIDALLGASYIGEWQPGFIIRKITKSDDQRKTGKTEDNGGESIMNTLDGFAIDLGLFYKF